MLNPPPRSPNLCMEIVVDCVCEPRIFHVWLPLRVAMSKHCEEPGCSFQMLGGGSLIDYNVVSFNVLFFSHQASLTRQAFLITPLHGARYKMEKTLTPKSSAMKSYVKLMRHPQHWYFPRFRCDMRKISVKRYQRAKLQCANTGYHGTINHGLRA